jgi:hypothetical protein
MNKEFPCKICTHPACQHYVNATKDDNICLACIIVERSRNCVDISEYHHEFVGDNFKYLELIDKREELKNE